MSDPQGSKATEIECEGGSSVSCQTPTNDQGPDNHEAPVKKLPVRAEQPEDAYLVKMPSEIILSITEHMDRQSLKSLALTSFRLHHTVRAQFYRSFNYETFRLALKTGDFDQIQRCIALKAAPADIIWGKEHEEPARPAHRNRRDLLYYFDHRPINYLDFAFEEGKITADQCLVLLRWLLENGGDISTTWADPVDDSMYPKSIGKLARFNKKMNHIPHYFLIALLKENDRTKLEGAASIICYLSDEGFNFPREIPIFESKLPRGCRSTEDYSEFVPIEPWNFYDPMMWMMGSARPPSVFEALLKQLRRQGATLTSSLEKCPESFRYVQYHRSATDVYENNEGTLITTLWPLVLQLYDDLLDPLNWRPIYDGEVGDIWEAKLNLLDKYQGMDDYERYYLVSILASIRKVEDKIRAQGVSVVRRNAKACFLELIATLLPESEESETETWHDVSRNRNKRIHMFIPECRANPGRWWDRWVTDPHSPFRWKLDELIELEWLDGL